MAFLRALTPRALPFLLSHSHPRLDPCSCSSAVEKSPFLSGVIFLQRTEPSDRRVVSSLPLGPPCDAVGNPPRFLLPCNSTFVSLLLEHQTVGAVGRGPSQSAPFPPLSFLPTMDLIIACLLSVRESCSKFPEGEGGCRAGRFSSLTHS